MPRKRKVNVEKAIPPSPSPEEQMERAASATAAEELSSEDLDLEEEAGLKSRGEIADHLQTSPNLFPNGKTTTRMASALPIWEASSILTQRQDLPWAQDPDGKLRYTRTAEDGQGAVHFWVTEDLEDESPATLAGAAALAMIDTFDIRAACMHLIYAAHAAQIERPWEQEFVIDDKQIEEYLGLKKRTDKTRQQKLALIREIAKQPCKITTFVSWPTQNRVKGFTLEEGRLWHLLGTRYHYQQDLFGKKELTGITFIVRAGLWARYFLNEEGQRHKNALCEYATLSKSSLRDVMGVWQQREGAARLMVWLLFKTKSDRYSPLPVEALMEIAFGPQYIEQAKTDSQVRKKLVGLWDDTLGVLQDRGWSIHFDPDTYPPELQPQKFNPAQKLARPRGFFDQLLKAYVWIVPQEDWADPEIVPEPEESDESSEKLSSDGELQFPQLQGNDVKAYRAARGWSQRKLSSLTGLSQGLISQIENGGRSITPENQGIFQRVFMSHGSASAESSSDLLE
jgi:hypothetical protein